MEYILSDIIELIGGGTPKTSVAEYWDGDIPWLSVKDFSGQKRYVYETEKCITEEGLNNSSTKYLNQDDIIVSARGTVGEMAMVPFPMTFNQSCYGIRAKRQLVDPFYLYYLMKYSLGELKSKVHGSVFDTITKDTFKQITVDLPDLEVQKKVADILGNFDDKIDNNEKINRNLEEQTLAIFKSWFMDKKPWEGEVPSSWIEGVLGDFVTIKRGGSPRPIQDFLSEGGLRWLKISDVTSLNSPFVIDIAEHIKESGLKKTVYLKQGALVLSNSATPGVPKILDVDSCIHDGWLYFQESQLSNQFLYLLFKHIRPKLVALGNGSVFTNLKTDILKGYSIVKPDNETLKKFDEIVIPIFEEMRMIAREIHRLSELRDALLPKLMSGELDVSVLNI
jgi:Restriction endonuclease S subunits